MYTRHFVVKLWVCTRPLCHHVYNNFERETPAPFLKTLPVCQAVCPHVSRDVCTEIFCCVCSTFCRNYVGMYKWTRHTISVYNIAFMSKSIHSTTLVHFPFSAAIVLFLKFNRGGLRGVWTWKWLAWTLVLNYSLHCVQGQFAMLHCKKGSSLFCSTGQSTPV